MTGTTEKLKLVSMEGQVKKVLMEERSKGFAIVSLISEDIPSFAIDPDYPNSFVAVGGFGNVVEGQRFKLKGKWNKHIRYGWRFNMEFCEEIAPTDREGLVSYLSSGLFKGIGPVTAERIVEMFGEKTLEVIKENPEELGKVKGISKKKAKTIGLAYVENMYLEELMLFLKPYEVTNNQIMKIYQSYKTEAISKLKENPYIMCEDIHGFGFKIADKIARAFGIGFDNEFRIKAGVLYALKDAASNGGHVYLEEEKLIDITCDLLTTYEGRVDANKVKKMLLEMAVSEDIVICTDKGGSDVYLPIYYHAEILVANQLKHLVNLKPPAFKTDIRESIKEIEDTLGMKYSDKQKDAILAMENNNFMVITGGPGVGKTTIIKAIMEIFDRNFSFSTIKLVAPTGRAAKKMTEATGYEAKTIHRELEYKKRGDRFEFMRNRENPIYADLLIVDEATMIDLLLFSKLLDAIGNRTRVVFVGDPDQLPSVGAGNIFYDLIESGKVPVTRLEEIFRQEDTSKIIINAALINKGDSYLELGDDFEYIWEDDDDEILELIKKEYLKEINKVDSIDSVQVLSPFRTRTVTGVDNLNSVLQEIVNPSRGHIEIRYGKKTYRVGDKVMQTKNDYERSIFNGDIGYIVEIYRKEVGKFVAMISFDGKVFDFEAEEFENLDLAYATTIHKSQGSEYDVIIMPMTTQHYVMLKRNMVYTGVTRAKKKVIMIGSQLALDMAVKNNEVALRNSNLKYRL